MFNDEHEERKLQKRADSFRPSDRVYDPRLPVLDEEGNVPAEPDLDDFFFSVHGVGDNPIAQKDAAVLHMIDATVPSIEENRFVRLLMKGMHKADAYEKAFDVAERRLTRQSLSRAADRILKRPRVAARYYELRERLDAIEDEDLSTVIQELNSAQKLARDLGQPSAAVQAIKTKASILGLMDEKKVTNNITVNLSDRQKSELLNRIGVRSQPRDIDDAEIIE